MHPEPRVDSRGSFCARSHLPGNFFWFPMIREIVNAEGAPPIGPYNHSVRCSGTMHFFSGQIPILPSGEMVTGSVAEQSEQVFKNIEAVLKANGIGFENIVKATVFLSSMDHFAAMNEVYSKWMVAPFPARSTVAVAGLPRNVDVEIEIVAVS